MPLETQLVTVPFGQGVDTKTDPKLLGMGKLTSLVNGRFDTTGALRKRYGYAALAQTIFGTGSISAGRKLLRYKDELLLVDGHSLYSYTPGLSEWVYKDTISEALTDRFTVCRDSAKELTKPDVAFDGTYVVHVWTGGGFGGATTSIYFTATDVSTGTIVVHNALVSVSGTTAVDPKVLHIGSHFIIFFRQTTTLKYVRVASADLSFTAGGTNLITTLNAVPIYDVCEVAGNPSPLFAVAYRSNTPSLLLRTYDETAVLVSSGTTGRDAVDAIGICANYGETLYLAWHDQATNDLKIEGFDPTTLASTFSATQVLAGAATPAPTQIAPVRYDSTHCVLVWEMTGGSPLSVQWQVVKNDGTIGGGLGGLNSLYQGSMVTKPWVVDGKVYVGTAYYSTVQATYFVMGLPYEAAAGVGYSRPVATLAQAEATTTYARGTCSLSNVVDLGSDKWSFTSEIVVQKISITGGLQTKNVGGIDRFDIDLSTNVGADKRFYGAELGPHLHIAAGTPEIYDGYTLVEDGFLLYPEIVSSANSTTGGAIANGTYSYVAVYEWTDNQGQIHRSAPSPPFSVTTAGADDTVTLTVPNLNFTKKGIAPGSTATRKNNVTVMIYRTLTTGTVYYRVSDPTGVSAHVPPVSQPLGPTNLLFIDIYADATISANAQLYTQGGALENIAPIAAKYVCKFSGRICYAGLENPQEVRFSKQYTIGEAPGFSEAFSIVIDGPDEITALSEALDEKLLIFTANKIFIVAGDGPNDQGVGGSFSAPLPLTTDAGCIDARSIVVTPDGVLFQSAKGICQLDRSLNVTYLGWPVEGSLPLTYSTVTSGQLVEDRHEIRWSVGQADLSSSGVLIVYDYFQKQWATWNIASSLRSVGGVVDASGVYTWLDSSGLVYQETVGAWADPGSAFISMSLTTGWMPFAQLPSFVRAKRMTLLGSYFDTHDLNITIYHDYQTGTPQTISLVNSTLSAANEQIQVHLQNQKVEAIKLVIADAAHSGGDHTEGFGIQAVAFEVGQKKGSPKLPAAART